MGMFDTLRVQCTCGKTIEIQSKAGDCKLAEYTLADCPADIAGQLIGTTRDCACGRTLRLYGHVMLGAEFTKDPPGGSEG